jgi:hypothetical protein
VSDLFQQSELYRYMNDEWEHYHKISLFSHRISCQVDLKLTFAFIGASNNSKKGIDLMNRSSSQINMVC